jgi:hypothetical protein
MLLRGKIEMTNEAIVNNILNYLEKEYRINLRTPDIKNNIGRIVNGEDYKTHEKTLEKFINESDAVDLFYNQIKDSIGNMCLLEEEIENIIDDSLIDVEVADNNLPPLIPIDKISDWLDEINAHGVNLLRLTVDYNNLIKEKADELKCNKDED